MWYVKDGYTPFLNNAKKAMLFGLLPGALPQPADTGRAPKAILYAIACGCAAVTLWYAIPAAGALAPTPESEIDESTLSNAFADLDELALQNPDLLYIYDSTFASDYRMCSRRPATAR